MVRAVAIGECRIELCLSGPDEARLGYGGEGLCMAVYLRRLDVETACATVVGRGDPFSAGILRRMAQEGVDASLVGLSEGRLPGLSALHRDGCAERRFDWRGGLPLLDLLRPGLLPILTSALRRADLVHVPMSALAGLGEGGRAQLLDLLRAAASAGAAIALDAAAYQPEQWPSAVTARAALEAFGGLARYVFVGHEISAALGGWRPPRAAEAVQRLPDGRVRVGSSEGDLEFRPGRAGVVVVDSAGSREAFCAAYLAARLSGLPTVSAVTAANLLAEAVTARPEALIPPAAMPLLRLEV